LETVRFVKLLVVLAVMLFGAAFAVMNAEPVNLDFYFDTRELPLSVVLVAAVCVGALLGVLAGLVGMARLKRENSELKRKARLASQEVNNLRAMPIKDH